MSDAKDPRDEAGPELRKLIAEVCECVHPYGLVEVLRAALGEANFPPSPEVRAASAFLERLDAECCRAGIEMHYDEEFCSGCDGDHA